MTQERAIRNYLGRLDQALRRHGSDRRREIVAEVESHIHEELGELDHEPTNAEVNEILDRIGDPKTIAAQEAGGSPARQRTRLPEIAALALLVAGGFLHLPIGWLAGVAILWLSSRWTLRQKLLGTFVIPCGLMLPIYIWLNGCGTSNPEFDGTSTVYICDWFGMRREIMIGIVAVLALASLVSVGYLSAKLRRPPDGSYLSRSILASPFLAVLILAGAIVWFSTREELASGVGTDGPWRIELSWEFTYCIKYQHSLGEGGVCGILPSHELEAGGRQVLRVDDVWTVVTGEIPPGTAEVRVIPDEGEPVTAELKRVMDMTMYVAELSGAARGTVQALDEDGNVIDEVPFKPGARPPS